LPATWCVYFLLNRFGLYRIAKVSLIVASFVFYGYEDVKLCFLLLTTILVNYAFHVFLIRLQCSTVSKVVLTVGILLNLSLLFYFKSAR